MPENTIGPATADDVERSIRRTGWSAYLYIGSASDDGWKHARRIDKDPAFPRLRVYRVADLAEVECWAHGVRGGGLVITHKGEFSTHIDRATTEKLVPTIIAVVEAIAA